MLGDTCISTKNIHLKSTCRKPTAWRFERTRQGLFSVILESLCQTHQTEVEPSLNYRFVFGKSEIKVEI
jgi:hypothetical protein